MQPEPLIWVRANHRLHRAGQLLRDRFDFFGTAQFRRIERSLDDDAVAAVGLAHRKGGEDGNAGAQCVDGSGGRGACGVAEELDEDAPLRPHVLVDGDRERLSRSQAAQCFPGRAAIGKLAHPTFGARGDQLLVDEALQLAADQGHPDSAARAAPSEELPVSEVADRDHHAAPTGDSLVELSEAVEVEPADDLGVGEPRREQRLTEAGPERAIHRSAKLVVLTHRLVRKGEREILHHHAAADSQMPGERADRTAHRNQEPPTQRLVRQRHASTASRAWVSADSPRRIESSIGTATTFGVPSS